MIKWYRLLGTIYNIQSGYAENMERGYTENVPSKVLGFSEKGWCKYLKAIFTI